MAGRLYFQDDTTPAGEVWFFNGVLWTDLGYSLQGDTGATGAAGATVIYNSEGSPTSFNSVGLTTIDTQSVSLTTNGSYVDIENDATLSVGNANLHTKITVGGVNVWENTPFDMGIANQQVRVRVHRVSSTSIIYQRWVYTSNTFTLPVIDFWYHNTSTDAVADMDSNPLTIVLQWGGVGTSRGLTLTKFVK